MTSHTTSRFLKALARLPGRVRQMAREAFKTWQRNPNDPSLRLKRVHEDPPVYSVRIGIHWRGLGVREGDEMTWFWIGSHSDYDKLISQM